MSVFNIRGQRGGDYHSFEMCDKLISTAVCLTHHKSIGTAVYLTHHKPIATVVCLTRHFGMFMNNGVMNRLVPKALRFCTVNFKVYL